MDIANIVIPVASMSAMGLALGLGLGYAGKKFAVEVDEKEEKILAALPGANCGGCGYPGCGGCAAAIAKGEAKVNACPVGGAAVAAVIADILGVKVEDSERMAAYVKCNGTCENAKEKSEYDGMMDCRAATGTPGGGAKSCAYGCLGLGSCVSVCKFGAISIVDGIAKVNPDKCTSCGMCVNICPKHIIELVPVKSIVRVECSSKDKGKDTMDSCSVGCIGCRRCEKTCQNDAIHVVDNVAKIDYSKCTMCKACVDVCPKKIIKC